MKISIFIHSMRGKNMNIIFFHNYVILKISFIIVSHYRIIDNYIMNLSKQRNHHILLNEIESILNYNDYEYFDRYFKSYPVGETVRNNFNETIDSMEKIPNNINFIKEILLELTRHLNGTSAFYYHGEPGPCNYINYWLNKEIRKSKNHDVYKSNFNLFKKYTDERKKIYRTEYKPACNEYIHDIDDETYKHMNILYELYNEYTTLTFDKKNNRTKDCSMLGILAKNYGEIIDNCYEKKKLFNNLINIKDLITKLISQKPTPCKEKIFFRESQKLLEEKLKKEEEEKAKQLKLEEEQRAEALKKEEEKRRTLEAQEETQQMLNPTGVHQGSFNQGATLFTERRENLRASSDLDVKGPNEVIDHSVGLDRSKRFENLKEHVSPQSSEYQLEDLGHKPGKEYTNTDGSFLGSSGFPGYITEVFRSVEPAPILGVSGGMGALFLLFKVFKVLKL
ncbi:hypothetical protein PVBG_05823 [Plasmodium vivax Brazil I]|uniref:Uncharacterized protein n=1 Tax=Plasmodium vivax (strain Brazil I) TaxID=1033975 RepID=A0A0J9T1A0_PLAV1|nr:hypothetical protein PVBG_05823 [Plasmodium vivax Brazil I]